MAKHTPGPFSVEDASADGVEGLAIVQTSTQALMTAVVLFDPRLPLMDSDPTAAEARANAHLFAAAPSLLSALEAVEWGGDNEWCAACSQHEWNGHEPGCSLHAALLLARGEK